MKPYLLIGVLVLSKIIYSQEYIEINLSKQLLPGWNNISYHGDKVLPVDKALEEIWDFVEYVKNENGFYQKGQPKYLNSLANLNFTGGYFVKVNTPCTLNWIIVKLKPVPDTATLAGTLTDIDGNEYPWLKIGEQCWMTANLRTTRYANGTAIPHLPATADWDTLTEKGKAYCFYDTTGTDYTQYTKETFGTLYTWAAATNGNTDTIGVQGACPDGWHLPSDDEWKKLEMFLDMTQIEVDDVGYRGSNQGSQLADSAELWYRATSLENDSGFGKSGFSAVPAGYRNRDGAFYNVGKNCFWWSSTQDYVPNAWSRYLNFMAADVGRTNDYKINGFSVRCIKD